MKFDEAYKVRVNNLYKNEIKLINVFLSVLFFIVAIFDILVSVSMLDVLSKFACVFSIMFHMFIVIISVNSFISSLYSQIIIKNNCLYFQDFTKFFVTKIKNDTVEKISFEKNTVIHDRKYEDDAVIVDILSFGKMYRFAISAGNIDLLRAALDNTGDGSLSSDES